MVCGTKFGLLLVSMMLGVFSLTACDQATSLGEVHTSKLPPLIDRNLFFGDPEIAGAGISPDGKWITFVKPYNDVMNIWVKGVAEPFDAARPLTADTRPVSGYFWSQDSRNVLYTQDKEGNENFHVYRVDPSAKPEAETGVPSAMDLTPYESTRAFIYDVPESTPRQMVVGLNDRDPALHDVYRVDLDTGDRDLLILNDANVGEWITDLTGNVRLAVRQRQDAGTDILLVNNAQLGKVLYDCSAEEDCRPIRFHKDGRRVYMVSNKGDDADLSGLFIIDVETGSIQLLERDPEGAVDFGGALFSDASEELIATYYVGDRIRIYPKTDKFERDFKFLRNNLPDGVLGFAGTTEDDRKGIVGINSDINPGSTYFYDLDARTVEKLYDLRPKLPAEHLAAMEVVRYVARDGQEIPAYLVVPKGVPPSNLPTIIMPHGGPWARDVWGYDGLAQFFANRGYAVLLPNFRGSTGFGKAFLNAGNKEWGTGVMQHDISDGVKYLIDRGIADPEQVAILGGSYGGYATLAGLTFTPDLYAAGVSIVGPSNIITLLNSIPPYWGPMIKMFYKRVGDPNDPEDRVRLKAQSPFFHADNIEAPLLVIQGANDPRVKQAESDQIVVAMRELGLFVEYLVAPDEGHGFRGEENELAMFVAIEEFLSKHLGGRHQKSVATEVAMKLKALTVDIDTVELPEY